MAEKITVGLEVDSKKAEKNVDNLTDGIKDLTKSVDEGNKQIKEGLDDIKETSKSTGEGVKGIGNAIKAAGVGLFLVALESMKELFMQNQVIADGVSSAFEGLALVFNDVFGLLTGGLESVEKIGNAFDKYFGKPIETAVKSFEKFGDAFSKIFGGDFSGALDDINLGMTGLQAAISQTGDGFAEATSDAVDYVVEIKEAAVANVQLAKSAEIAEATNAGLLEKYDRQAEQQRQIRDEERNSIEDRIAANNKLGEVLEEQNTVMLKNANISLRAAQIAFDKNKSTENEVALITAKNEVMAVEATVEGFRSEQKANDLALDREKIELTNSKLEAESTLSFERRKFNAEQEQNAVKRIEKLKEINVEERSSEQARLQAIVDEANLGTQAKVDAQIALDEFMETSRQESVTLEKEYTEELVAEEQKRKEAELASFVQTKEIQQAKLGVLQNGLSVLKGVTESNLKLQKAIIVAEAATSIGQIIMNTQVANAKAKALAPPLGLPFTAINTANAVIGIAATIASSKKALSAIGKGGSIASEVVPSEIGGSGSAQMESQAPAFNIVGQSGVNQIADVVASQAPVKAYVVANDVTTAQSLERNIVEGATL
tara:strand:+ start:186 stop:1994 length:1809 start_codon:yes stop_codon:yes gene_type:complete